jgi:predicted neuraminidase
MTRYNPTSHGRKPLALAQSDDGGATWRTLVTFDAGVKEYEYPTTLQVGATTYTTFSAPTSEGIMMATFDL